MKKIIIGAILATLMVGGAIGMMGAVGATGVDDALDIMEKSSPTPNADVESVVKIVIDTMLYIIGIISVIMIIFGGIKYATSAGDTSKVTSAKNTLIYSVVGLLVAILAFAIVNFVYNSVA